MEVNVLELNRKLDYTTHNKDLAPQEIWEQTIYQESIKSNHND